MRPPVRRLVRIALPILLAYLVVCRVVENRRIDRPLPRSQATATPPKLTATSLLDDLRTLSSDAFEGRATDTPGGRKAGDFVAARFRDLGLQSFGGRYDQPFAFDHRSIRALWRRDRPFVKHVDGRNVIGYVTGSARADEFLVLSAHYDHLGARNGEIYHGADDNASGVAGLLAMAAYLRAHRPLHSIVFAAFDAEELGVRGAEAFVDALPFPAPRLRLDINLDMISRSADGRLFVAGTYQYPFLTPVVERAAEHARIPIHLGHDRPMYLSGLIQDWTSGSDHFPFHARGIPFLYFGVEDHSDYHQPTDTFDRIDRSFYLQACEVILDAVLAADAPDAPQIASLPDR